MDRRLLLADGVVFTCQHSGACCRSDWRIGVDPGRHARLRGVDWSPREGRPDGELFVPLPEPTASGERVEVARRPDAIRKLVQERDYVRPYEKAARLG